MQLRRAPFHWSRLHHRGHQCGDMAAAALLPFTGRPTLRHSRSRRFSGHSSLSRITGAPRPSFPTLLQRGLVTPVAFAMCSSYGWPTCRGADPNSSFQKRRGSFRRRILIMNRLPNSTVLPNNAMHLTRREGAAVRSLRPVVEARLAGERRCWTELLPGREACSRGREPDGPEGQVPQ